MTELILTRVGPLTTIQDSGRFGMLRHGISASGPMDRSAYAQAAQGGHGAIEFTASGLDLEVTGPCRASFAGGDFTVRHNGTPVAWPGYLVLAAGNVLSITPGRWGNYGYLRFDGDLATPPVLGSISTSSRVGLGGLAGRTLQGGDRLSLRPGAAAPENAISLSSETGALRVVWGLHASLFSPAVRDHFLRASFTISDRLDRMGVRLTDGEGVFAGTQSLSLVSDALVPGDIQILGDGTPIVLMRDHQPTGGYPRIATIVSADLDRFAQQRPGTAVAFQPVTVDHAHRLLRSAP